MNGNRRALIITKCRERIAKSIPRKILHAHRGGGIECVDRVDVIFDGGETHLTIELLNGFSEELLDCSGI